MPDRASQPEAAPDREPRPHCSRGGGWSTPTRPRGSRAACGSLATSQRGRRGALPVLLAFALVAASAAPWARAAEPGPGGAAGPTSFFERTWAQTHDREPWMAAEFREWQAFSSPMLRLGLDEYQPYAPSLALLDSAPGWRPGGREPLGFGIGAPPAERSLPGWAPAVLMMGALAASEFAAGDFSGGGFRFETAFDGRVRHELSSDSSSGREAAALASDVLLGGLGAALMVDWIWLRDEYGGLESIGTDGSFVMANLMSTQIAKRGFERERPYGSGCRSNPAYVGDCGDELDMNASFYSGHASTAGTLAGLICARHLNREQRSWRDPASCGGAVATSLATGMLRVAAEKHFATDVLVGWAAGAVFGYLLPDRYVYGGGPTERWAPRFAPVVGTGTIGARYLVAF